MTGLNGRIKELQQKIDELMPNLNQKKTDYDKASSAYFLLERKKQELQNEIDAIKKRLKTESFKKFVGKGELLSFREFFKEIREGRDFSNKTIIWCSKDGKSGFFVNIWIHDSETETILLEKYHQNHIYDPLHVIKLLKEFPSKNFDDFGFQAFTVGSMVNGHTFYDKKLDDVYISIHDTKTLADFSDVTSTKGLRFFEPGHLPYIEESLGELSPEHDNAVSLRGTYVPKDHCKNYVLYPAKAGSEGDWCHSLH